MNPNPRICYNVPGRMTVEELDYVMEVAKTVSSWTELGGFIGRSFLAAGLSLPKNSFIQVVDKYLSYWKEQGQTILDTFDTLQRYRTDLDIVLCKCDSERSAGRLKGTDVVFIDAAHSYDAVFADIKAWRGKAKILMGHDYSKNHPGTMQAVNELCPNPVVVGSIWRKDL